LVINFSNHLKKNNLENKGNRFSNNKIQSELYNENEPNTSKYFDFKAKQNNKTDQKDMFEIQSINHIQKIITEFSKFKINSDNCDEKIYMYKIILHLFIIKKIFVHE